MKLLLTLLLAAAVAADNGAPVARAYRPAWLRPRSRGRRRAARPAGRHSHRTPRPDDPRDAATVRLFQAINVERTLTALVRSGPSGAQAAIAVIRAQAARRTQAGAR